MRTTFHVLAFAIALLNVSVRSLPAQYPGNNGSSFTAFETGQVRPLALSGDRKTLFAVNTPDNRLEILDVSNDGHTLRLRESVNVGLEPVAVAVRNGDEVWVVNHLSDSVSIVKLSGRYGPHVERTLLVGDEPRDIVFAGPGGTRAFITTAHRGQNTGRDPQLTTPGVGRADVWVFNAGQLGQALGGTPITVLTLFTDTPRALAVSPDGRTVYAAGFLTGNRTASMFELTLAPGALPGPRTNFQGNYQPHTGLIVKFDGSHWTDKQTGQVWDNQVKFTLPDRDVFAIDAMANPPSPVAGPGGIFASVGTVLFNMAVNPVSGKVYVSNTDANNAARFEGPGLFGGSTVRGHLHESHISILSKDGSVAVRHLNKHIDYGKCCAPVPNPENAKSLAFPTGMEVTRDGKTLYVAAMGSSKVGIFDTAALENNTFVPSTGNQVQLSGGGPTGLALNELAQTLYVMTRFDNSISVVDTRDRLEVAHVALYNPEPASITQGRRLLYDAQHTSSHGDSACASCHVFGDFDALGWDLGNPDGVAVSNIMPRFSFFPTDPIAQQDFQPMKGPMVTQSLRGMLNAGPMHWRGDRNGSLDTPGGQFDETRAFKKFNVAFQTLLGSANQLSDAELQAFTDFILQVTYPPNPIRNLDNSDTPDQAAGRAQFFAPNTLGTESCNFCHRLDPAGFHPDGASRPGFFGTQGDMNLETFDPIEPQPLKVPHLRNMYQKVGRFGTGSLNAYGPPIFENRGDSVSFPFMGDQIRGFGFLHDGGMDSLFRFFTAFPFSSVASIHGFAFGPDGDPARRQMEAFMLAFDSNLAPIVGQQVTLTAPADSQVLSRIHLMMARAAAAECDLVAKVRLDRETGFLYDNHSNFVADRHGAPPVPLSELIDLARDPNAAVTFTCVPPGSGVRIGLNRYRSGNWDGDPK